MDTVNKRLQKIRKLKGMTQLEVSQKAEINPSLYRQYECGDRTPKLDALQKIASAMEVDVAFFKPLSINTDLSLLALLFNLVDEYGDVKMENKGGTTLVGIDHLNYGRESEHLRLAKLAHDELSVEDFKKWLVNYPPKVHNGAFGVTYPSKE